MKKILSSALILFSVFAASKVQAQTLSVADVKLKIEKQVCEKYQNYTDADLKAKVIALPFQSLILPDGNVVFKVSSVQDKFLPRDLKKVDVYVNSKLVRNFNVPVEVLAYKDVLVASGPIDRDKYVTKEMTKTQKMEISNQIDYILTDKYLDKEIVSKKMFRDGEILDKRFVKLKPDVQRNANVVTYFASDSLMITLDAIALSDGMLGDYVNVESKGYKKTYTGKVVGENKVMIKL